MDTVAVLAPITPDATLEQLERAQRATLQQMMLIARGHAVDSVEVRCAAELVCSALTTSPDEFEIAEAAEMEAPSESSPSPDAASARLQRSYQRYLRTIMGEA